MINQVMLFYTNINLTYELVCSLRQHMTSVKSNEIESSTMMSSTPLTLMTTNQAAIHLSAHSEQDTGSCKPVLYCRLSMKSCDWMYLQFPGGAKLLGRLSMHISDIRMFHILVICKMCIALLTSQFDRAAARQKVQKCQYHFYLTIDCAAVVLKPAQIWMIGYFMFCCLIELIRLTEFAVDVALAAVACRHPDSILKLPYYQQVLQWCQILHLIWWASWF